MNQEMQTDPDEVPAPIDLPLDLELILFVDLILLAVFPLILNAVYLFPLAPAVMGLQVWYSPWNAFAGYFCWPFGLSFGPIFNILIAAAVFFTGRLKDTGRMGLLVLIVIQNVLAVLGLAYHASLAAATEYMVESGLLTRNLNFMWSRMVFSFVMIGINMWYFTRPRIVRLFQRDNPTIHF